jgi:hypothetical protein
LIGKIILSSNWKKILYCSKIDIKILTKLWITKSIISLWKLELIIIISANCKIKLKIAGKIIKNMWQKSIMFIKNMQINANNSQSTSLNLRNLKIWKMIKKNKILLNLISSKITVKKNYHILFKITTLVEKHSNKINKKSPHLSQERSHNH